MSKKVRKNLKMELVLKEREQLIQNITNIDALLDDQLSTEEQEQLRKTLNDRMSFRASVNWVQPLIEDSLSEIPNKLSLLIEELDRGFPIIEDEEQTEDQQYKQLSQRIKAQAIIKMHIDGSLILHALGRNSAAIIELHGVLERQAIQRLVSLLTPPTMNKLGLRLIERSTLSELSSMLHDSDIINKEDMKFAQRLTTIRNGLAHRNTKILSNAVLSGKEVRQFEIDTAISEIDFHSILIKAIQLLIKLLKWEEEN